MCGIAGSFGRPLFGAAGPDDEVRAVLAHRGPDGFGWWQEDDVSLLHWRLAVIDLSPAGHQPMLSHDGRFVLSYNGEIYNFETLRKEVSGVWESPLPEGSTAPPPPVMRRWRGRSDTEVLLESFALWGPDLLSRLNGIFALALLDRATGRLHLARDRAGVKPLYVWERDGQVLFASEAKFFFVAAESPPSIDASGLSAFFTYGNCHDDRHVLAGVRQLMPGEVITFERGGSSGGGIVSTRARLWRRPPLEPVSRSDADATDAVRRLLGDAVARQLVADVPVGVFLSGGVDSSILTALAARHLGPAKTQAFTLGYRGMGPDYDEIAHARSVARHLGVQHHVYEATQDDLIGDLERLVWHYDEPFGDAAALNVFVLSRLVRSRVTVALAGEGSDELFGGYRRYYMEKLLREFRGLRNLLCSAVRTTGLNRARWVPRRVHVILRAIALSSAPARYSSYLESGEPIGTILKPEWHRAVGVHPIIEEEYPDDSISHPVGRLCLADQRFWLPSTYLEKSDKGGMAHGLEIRVPYLDNDVVEFANSLPDRQRIRGTRRKWLLWRAFGDTLPAEVFGRFKRGFGVPIGAWLRHDLREYYADHVLSSDGRARNYLSISEVERRFREHVRGVRDHAGLLWWTLVLEVWLRHYERGFRRPKQRPARHTHSSMILDVPSHPAQC